MLITTVLFLSCAVCFLPGDKPETTRTPADSVQEKIDAQFSPWDGSHRRLVSEVQRRLNDPGSFEHLETKTLKGTGYPKTFIVRMEYTAKNAFGGRVRKYVLVEVSVDTGQIVEVLGEG
ncbi:MAG: hypothetical protein F4Z14_00505 [Gammaproteobacteria bacterium]|nr:hypothetical protein [Gammaproteobacteria bacterium]